MEPIIFLNGTSSAGKSSIARYIQKQADIPVLHVKLDDFLRMVRRDRFRSKELSARIVQGFHRSIRELAHTGNALVVDHVLQEESWFHDLLVSLNDVSMYIVGIHCELEEVKRRELARGNRRPGTAEYQYTRVHAGMTYDLEIDTTSTNPADCAAKILHFVTGNGEPLAWKRMVGDKLPAG